MAFRGGDFAQLGGTAACPGKGLTYSGRTFAYAGGDFAQPGRDLACSGGHVAGPGRTAAGSGLITARRPIS